MLSSAVVNTYAASKTKADTLDASLASLAKACARSEEMGVPLPSGALAEVNAAIAACGDVRSHLAAFADLIGVV